MKLVNETRQSAAVSKPVQPIFDREAATESLAKLEADGYYKPIGDTVERMYEIAAEVADQITEISGDVQLMVRQNTDIPYQRYRKLLSKKPIRDASKYFAKVKDARIDIYRTLDEEDIPDIDFILIAEYNRIDEAYVYTVRNYDKQSFSIIGRTRVKTKYDNYSMEVSHNGSLDKGNSKTDVGQGSIADGYTDGDRMPGNEGTVFETEARGPTTKNDDTQRSTSHGNNDSRRIETIQKSDRLTDSMIKNNQAMLKKLIDNYDISKGWAKTKHAELTQELNDLLVKKIWRSRQTLAVAKCALCSRGQAWRGTA